MPRSSIFSPRPLPTLRSLHTLAPEDMLKIQELHSLISTVTPAKMFDLIEALPSMQIFKIFTIDQVPQMFDILPRKLRDMQQTLKSWAMDNVSRALHATFEQLCSADNDGPALREACDPSMPMLTPALYKVYAEAYTEHLSDHVNIPGRKAIVEAARRAGFDVLRYHQIVTDDPCIVANFSAS